MVTMRNRFAPARPIGFFAGDSNLYRFVGNDPLNEVDSSGLISEKEAQTAIEEFKNSEYYKNFAKGIGGKDLLGHIHSAESTAMRKIRQKQFSTLCALR